VGLLPARLAHYLTRATATLFLPCLLACLALLLSLPRLARNPPPPHSALPALTTVFLAHTVSQVPVRAAECALQYAGPATLPTVRLVLTIAQDLPLLMTPLGLLLLRGRATNPAPASAIAKQVEGGDEGSPCEENIKMIVSLEGKELETALFKAKTTSL